MPSSTCIVCHIHPGTNVVNSFLGYQWWDNETDGHLLYPSTERSLSATQVAAIQARNPEGAALRGKWSDPEFLANIVDLNPQLSRMQLGDFHGHGWIFRAVFKHDRRGNMLDAAGRQDVLLTGGGIIPAEDMAALEAEGTGKLFGPGTPTSDLIKYIQEWAAEHVAA